MATKLVLSNPSRNYGSWDAKLFEPVPRQKFLSVYNICPPNCLTFPNPNTKINYGNAHDSDCFGNFWKKPKSAHCQTWVGIVASWRKSWVRNNRDKAWDREPWHAWAVALVKNEFTHINRNFISTIAVQTWRKLKMVVAWTVYKHNFMKVAREKCGRNLNIWYGGNNAQRGRDKCLRFAFKWMQEVASHPDTPPKSQSKEI